ncbi:MAG: 5-bromo-4-chloroindolyl phosphate hydrolysis family protein [Gammaproteobacteria bacterium]|nr:5-bromo-4-chloroindolyl phosphate hydrolysis family protein [Gammaproteobacteria bacterium]MBU1723481.1 5-bromo-4-chloroindolyl phosphate hydrolysis family protein [Gammaproteobacteria bacterium]MBU2004229.1 5-bromo-4-chloroindolyl phosphate hydrolysis family protein [Gammaproteobacteria bacterium]
MLKLKEIWRQIVAGMLAALAFTAVYLGLSLVWWAALLIGLAIYAASLLLIERAPEDHEVYVYANLTQQDINAAVRYCMQAARDLRAASKANRIDANTAIALERMAQLVEEIGRNYQQDARDLKHSRNFTNHYLPKILELVKDYTALSDRTITESSQERLKQVGGVIRGYLPNVQTIHDACLENDFEKLELETSVLGDVMKLAIPAAKETSR